MQAGSIRLYISALKTCWFPFEMANFSMSAGQAVAVASLLVLFTYLYSKLYYMRFKQNAHFPQLPPSLLFGHLTTFGKIMKQGHLDRHPGRHSLGILSAGARSTSIDRQQMISSRRCAGRWESRRSS